MVAKEEEMDKLPEFLLDTQVVQTQNNHEDSILGYQQMIKDRREGEKRDAEEKLR